MIEIHYAEHVCRTDGEEDYESLCEGTEAETRAELEKACAALYGPGTLREAGFEQGPIGAYSSAMEEKHGAGECDYIMYNYETEDG